MGKAVDKWVLGGAETEPNFYVKDIAHSTQHTTALICSESRYPQTKILVYGHDGSY